MTSPVDGNDVFGILTVQYTFRFIGKARTQEGGPFDMTKLEDVKRAYVLHSRRSRSADVRPSSDITGEPTQP